MAGHVAVSEAVFCFPVRCRYGYVYYPFLTASLKVVVDWLVNNDKIVLGCTQFVVWEDMYHAMHLTIYQNI